MKEDMNKTDLTMEEEENYYGFLNVSRTATKQDIEQAYRRLSKLYHPDRHVDPNMKDHAKKLFNRTRKAYETLVDENKRAIYDTVGIKGLEITGWEVVERRTHPEEIREEYERLKRLQEEQLLLERANPAGNISVNVNVINAIKRISDEDIRIHKQYYTKEELEEEGYYDSSPYQLIEMTGLKIGQSVELPLTREDRFILGGSLAVTNGAGGGNLALTYRRLITNQMWGECTGQLGDDPSCSVKLVRTFSKSTFGSFEAYTAMDQQWSPIPGFNVSLTTQLDKMLRGSIVFKFGAQNNVTTSLVYENAKRRQLLGAVVVGLPTTFMLLSYTHTFGENDASLKNSVKLGGFGAIYECAYERRVSQFSYVGCTCKLLLPRGQLSVKVKLFRASQQYQVDLALCDQLEQLYSAALFGVAIPIISYQIVKFTLRPYWKKVKPAADADKQAEIISEKRAEAMRTINLMKESASRSKAAEEKKKGLIIIEAWYGKLISTDAQTQQNNRLFADRVVDVTVPLQTMVADSKLMIYDAKKSSLAGFFDPCPEEEKSLQVTYKFQGQLHRVTVKDDQPLLIPKQCNGGHGGARGVKG